MACFSGGTCIDADSDSFHYIGYAESQDLIHWTVVNGINNPIASVFPATLSVNQQGVPATGPGTSLVTIPAQTPVVGNSQGFFAGRVYAPSATRLEDNDITVIFAGCHTQNPKTAWATIAPSAESACTPIKGWKLWDRVITEMMTTGTIDRDF